ncbi:hypothetical protein U8527_03065 [Kordia algicida OT-1]|uniref:Uncharacterized protein n=1 Tax=Kordia algicida OT-1 TaxID=391587 RepID=A9DNW4_9FLAO|nr:hypothetical protein [Kordia algicida]EDP97296.1 hypothetical protein KAOT1_19077 [Kordia algicida OT-1]
MNSTKIVEITILLFLLLLCSCESTPKSNTLEIAKTIDDEIVFIDKDKLIEKLENDLLTTKQRSIKINEIHIDFSKAVDNQASTIIQLIGSNKIRSTQISYVLRKEQNVFLLDIENTILVCEGCTVGCLPKRLTNNEGYCTPCDITHDDTCIKTESLIPENKR